MLASAQDMINKWVADGDTRERAIRRWELITKTPLPEIIKPFIKYTQEEAESAYHQNS